MITAADLHGVMGMMPAFATDDGGDFRATATVDVDRLQAGVDRMVRDGLDVIATTGSFGEFHTLLPDEFETLAHATVETVNKRIPVFIGCTGLNTREAIQRMKVAEAAGAEGVLVGVPFYFPSSVDNAIQFFKDISGLFPKLGIMIYHNPPLHNIHIPVSAFNEIAKLPNVVAMKDSHRDTAQFIALDRIIRGKISVFVNQGQYFPFSLLGAPGFWSIDAWMGPWPQFFLRDAVARGDYDAAKEAMAQIQPVGAGGPPDLSWRETASKVMMRITGYCDPGPLRAPFTHIPPAVQERIERRAAAWKELCAKYRPLVEAEAAAARA